MGSFFGPSFLTTVFGILAAIFGGLQAMPAGTLPVGLQGWLQFLFAASVGGLGIAAKSYNVTNAPVPAEAAIAVEGHAAMKTKSAVPERVIKP